MRDRPDGAKAPPRRGRRNQADKRPLAFRQALSVPILAAQKGLAIDLPSEQGAAEFDFLKRADRVKYLWPVRERVTVDADVYSTNQKRARNTNAAQSLQPTLGRDQAMTGSTGALDAPVVPLALVHHANQYVITDGYAERQGVADILGLRASGTAPRGLLALLQMHLQHRVPLNLHLSGTFVETLAWNYPESFLLIKRLRAVGLLELVGSTLSQNVMPFFSKRDNVDQLNAALWMYREHLKQDPRTVKVLWIPERVWDTARVASAVRDRSLLNGGYRYVLLDDRLSFPGGDTYPGSKRERFDQERALSVDAFSPWEIAGTDGLVMLPISKRLRYLVPPAGQEAFEQLFEIFGWLARCGSDRVIAVYGDDLEKAAGVGGWDPLHPERYEQFLHALGQHAWIRPVLISAWAATRDPAGVRTIERGTFFELARSWRAGEDYRGWHEDPACAAHRQFLARAGRALDDAQARGADPALVRLGRRHLLHSMYETAWHNVHLDKPQEPQALAPWAAALTSHARSCLVVAAAAEWFSARDGAAHADLIDLDEDGELELVLKNDRLLAVFSPRWGGRLTYLFDLTGRAGRLVVGNISDDWNLQEDLNRYMDHPRNHPGAFADVGHEHDRYEPTPIMASGELVTVCLRNVEPASALQHGEKWLRLAARTGHLSVRYHLPRGVSRVSTEICLSPDYERLLRYGRKVVAPFDGRDWRGWRNGSTTAWVQIVSRHSTFWDRPHQAECGHGLNLRVTSVARHFHLCVGLGHPRPSAPEARAGLLRSPAATAPQIAVEPDRSLALVTDPHFMRRFLAHNLLGADAPRLSISACRVRVLKPHHDKVSLEYTLASDPRGRELDVGRVLVGMWRRDGRNEQLYQLLRALWLTEFRHQELSIAQPWGYWSRLQLMLTEKARGAPLKQWVYGHNTEWTDVLRRVGAWLAKLHRSRIVPAHRLRVEHDLTAVRGWRDELLAGDQSWLVHESARIDEATDWLLRRARSLAPGALCLTHGDFHPGNIFVRGTAITVIDFEHASLGDPARDLGYLIGQLDLQADRYWLRQNRDASFEVERARDALVDGYARLHTPPPPSDIALHQAWTYLRHLIYTVRMKGSEPAVAVTLWLDKAMACLELPAAAARSAHDSQEAAVASN